MAKAQIDDSAKTIDEQLKEAEKRESEQNNQQHPPANGLTEAELQKLLSDPAELRTLAKSKLIEIVHGSKATIALVPAIKEMLDRIDGKAPQSISMDVKDTRLDKMPIDRLLRLAAHLDDPVIVLPPSSKLDIE